MLDLINLLCTLIPGHFFSHLKGNSTCDLSEDLIKPFTFYLFPTLSSNFSFVHVKLLPLDVSSIVSINIDL